MAPDGRPKADSVYTLMSGARVAEAVEGGGFPFHGISVGCAGWNIPTETGLSFAEDGTHLERYSRALNCCEINSSF